MDSRITYAGQQNGQDLYQLIDEGGDLIRWAVAVGDDARSVLPGTLQNLGKAAGVTTSATVAADSRVTKTSSADGRDTYQLTDEGGNLIRWQVNAGAPYQDAIQGTVQNLGATSNAATVTPTATSTRAPALPSAANAETIPTTSSEIARASVGTLAPAAAAPRAMADNTHIYVGSVGERDLYQLTDEGGDLIRWAVATGDDSRAVLPNTVQNLGSQPAPNPSISVAPRPALVGTAPSATPAAAGVPGAVASPTNASLSGTATPTSSRAKFIGSANGRDTYQLIDEGGDLIQWQVNAGAPYQEAIGSSVQNLGKTAATTGAASTTTGEKSTALIVVGLLSALVSALK